MPKTKTQIKKEAQEHIMHMVGNVMYAIGDDPDLTAEEKELVYKEAEKQADRIAKMFGFERAWFN